MRHVVMEPRYIERSRITFESCVLGADIGLLTSRKLTRFSLATILQYILATIYSVEFAGKCVLSYCLKSFNVISENGLPTICITTEEF